MKYAIGLGVVVMLAVGLMAANPADSSGIIGACCYGNGTCTSFITEAACDDNNGTFYPGVTSCLGIACVPDVPPTVVGGTLLEGQVTKVFRFWSDGTVDQLNFIPSPNSCDQFFTFCNGPFVIFRPPACPEDIDNNSDVGVTDLLQLLGKWGPCQ